MLAYDPTIGQEKTQTLVKVFINRDRLDLTLTLHATRASMRNLSATTTDQATHGAETAREQAQAVAGHGLRAPPDTAATATTEEVIHTTANHPWLTTDRGWLVAGALRVGEPVRLLDGGVATVVALHALPGAGPMWDLSLDAIHTFAVGDAQAIVHNCPDVGGPGDGTFTPKAKTVNSLGELTNGTYTVDNRMMAAHLPDTAVSGRSVFSPDIDANSTVLDAAQYADENGLWSPENKARVFVKNVGLLGGTDEPTDWLTVTRNKFGYIHGWPVKGP